jgi:hypothetical protein
MRRTTRGQYNGFGLHRVPLPIHIHNTAIALANTMGSSVTQQLNHSRLIPNFDPTVLRCRPIHGGMHVTARLIAHMQNSSLLMCRFMPQMKPSGCPWFSVKINTHGD